MTTEAAGGMNWGPKSWIAALSQNQQSPEPNPGQPHDIEPSEPIRTMVEKSDNAEIRHDPDEDQQEIVVEEPDSTMNDEGRPEPGLMLDADPETESGSKACKWCGQSGMYVLRNVRVGRGRKKHSEKRVVQFDVCEACLRRRASPEGRAAMDEPHVEITPSAPPIQAAPDVPSAEDSKWTLLWLAREIGMRCPHCGRMSNEPVVARPTEPVVTSGVVSVPAPTWGSGPTILPRRTRPPRPTFSPGDIRSRDTVS